MFVSTFYFNVVIIKLKSKEDLVISKMSNTFTFTDDFGETQNQCETKISVELKTYDDGRKFYYVDYTHNMIYPNGTKKLCIEHKDVELPNPFSYFEKFKESFDGDIIAYNSLTEKLVEYLLLDDKELEKFSGSVTPQCYRKQLMYNIAILSD